MEELFKQAIEKAKRKGDDYNLDMILALSMKAKQTEAEKSYLLDYINNA